MSFEQENSVVERKGASASAGARASLLFVAVEHGVYFATGVLLALTAVLALVSAAISIWEATLVWGAPEQIIVTIDRLLFVLMLVEVLHTVRVSVRDGKLTAEPFLVVGLIASIRRVLAITLGSSHAAQPGHWTPDAQQQFNASMLELGVLAALILVMVFAIYLLGRKQEAPAADGPI
jgi:uncharacterized membrane protein (DUF373 family)